MLMSRLGGESRGRDQSHLTLNHGRRGIIGQRICGPRQYQKIWEK